MYKHYGNFISWSSILISIISLVLIVAGTISINYALAAVFIASFLDLFDGRVARKFIVDERDFVFGELTDSLCDVINFSLLPMLVYLHFQNQTPLIAILIMFLFIWSGVFRLARFSRDKDLLDHRTYSGLPVTIAGPLSVFFTLVFQNSLLVVALIQILLSLLMISKIKIKKL